MNNNWFIVMAMSVIGIFTYIDNRITRQSIERVNKLLNELLKRND